MPEPISQAFQPLKGRYFAPDHHRNGGLGIVSVQKDAIMAAADAFKIDTRENRVNLGIGVCSSEGGELVVPKPIQTLLSSGVSEEMLSGNYLPGQGDEGFLKAARNLIFGTDINPANISSIQTIGGTNALYVAMAVADYAQFNDPSLFANCSIHIPQATWGNHLTVAHLAGFKTEGIRDPKLEPKIQRYPYLSADGQSIEVDALLSYIDKITESGMILFHASCMNFCGIDPDNKLWDDILDKVIEKQNSGIMLVPIFDCAYQGFGGGADADVYSIRRAAEKGIRFLVAESYSKKLGLYRHRTGATHFYSPDSEEASAMRTNLISIQRGTNSSCPIAGAFIAREVMNDQSKMEDIFRFWRGKRYKFETARSLLAVALENPNLALRSGMFVLVPGLDTSRLWNEQAIQTIPVSWKDKDGNVCHGARICIDPIADHPDPQALMDRIKAVL